jgi:hypothetical protein
VARVMAPSWGFDAALQRPAPEELEAQYAAYRRRQARGLVRLLPREAVRPLYRCAVEDSEVGVASADPLGALLQYCERILPLPPFETWCEDIRLHATAHLRDLDDSADAPTADAPASVVARRFEFDDAAWIATLRSFREGTTWRGYIAFEHAGSHDVHRTTLIFREEDPVGLRQRFLDFDTRALQAFLRSALP